MTTIDLSTPPPAPSGLLDALPRRVALTLAELRLVAERAGGAPLPFDVVAPPDAPPLEGRLGQSRGTSEDQAYLDAVASLHDPADSLARRGLMSGETVDEGLLGAVGLLATPTLALDLDVVAGAVQAKAWHRQSGDAVATLATVDGIVFELAWFPNAHWPSELARVAVVPEDLELDESAVPDLVDLPYELVDAAIEAAASSRADLLPVLASQHAHAVHGPDDRPLGESEVVAILTALTSEARGRLRGMVADVSSEDTTVVGVVSWVLLSDGWRALCPHESDGALRVGVRRVEAADLAPHLAPVLAEVSS
ncbi:hypothetical protein NSZ01_11430 [Nocardioides szechwanensis]|uniref:EspG family protein n=1 Tax=Nocardioides szechwanensis TaxID=1005944 RepID=A0A1H0CNW8_9ACTN|nr:hypothetical protein [Nocardioides szechwanensis]GEP33375.1 hypothetical protein NSZ01_11430 [Nocardioides szechwanensis]SDN59525.1 hypothetical protein SAMN05192576_2481 [Nocardioides szechwanensis]